MSLHFVKDDIDIMAFAVLATGFGTCLTAEFNARDVVGLRRGDDPRTGERIPWRWFLLGWFLAFAIVLRDPLGVPTAHVPDAAVGFVALLAVVAAVIFDVIVPDSTPKPLKGVATLLAFAYFTLSFLRLGDGFVMDAIALPLAAGVLWTFLCAEWAGWQAPWPMVYAAGLVAGVGVQVAITAFPATLVTAALYFFGSWIAVSVALHLGGFAAIGRYVARRKALRV